MKSNIFIFHGTAGYPEENWFPWLKEKLASMGHKVFVPQFPTPEEQSLQAWLEVFKAFQNEVDENTIFVGHSLGGVFTLRLLERLSRPVKAAVFVGTPIGIQPLKNYESDKNFSGFDFDWQKIKDNAKYFAVYQSDDDPYVPIENGRQLADQLGVEMIFIPHAGHFNKRAGYTEFNELLNFLKSAIL